MFIDTTALHPSAPLQLSVFMRRPQTSEESMAQINILIQKPGLMVLYFIPTLTMQQCFCVRYFWAVCVCVHAPFDECHDGGISSCCLNLINNDALVRRPNIGNGRYSPPLVVELRPTRNAEDPQPVYTHTLSWMRAYLLRLHWGVETQCKGWQHTAVVLGGGGRCCRQVFSLSLSYFWAQIFIIGASWWSQAYWTMAAASSIAAEWDFTSPRASSSYWLFAPICASTRAQNCSRLPFFLGSQPAQ